MLCTPKPNGFADNYPNIFLSSKIWTYNLINDDWWLAWKDFGKAYSQKKTHLFWER